MSAATNETSFTTTYDVEHSVEEVYEAITHVGDWWTGDIEGRSERLGDEFTYRVAGVHDSRQRVIELVPRQRIAWEVVDADLRGRKTPDEWIGTHIVFDLTPTGTGTQIQFTHEGLVPTLECYGDCAYAWTFFVTSSLRALITTGDGPTPPPWA